MRPCVSVPAPPDGPSRCGVGWERGSAFMSAVILTIGSVMTFVSLFCSPKTKNLHLDQVGCIVGEPGTAEVDPEFVPAAAD